ncbi:FliH/SctL family protein [candidate division KSB1 bacterium]
MSNTVNTTKPIQKIKLIANPKYFIPLFKETLEKDKERAAEEKYKEDVAEEVKRVIDIALDREREKLNKEFEQKLVEKHDEGKDVGIEICQQESSERVERALGTLKSIIEDATFKRTNILNNAEKDVLELASYLAEKVILKKIDLDKGIVVEVVKDTLKYISGEVKIKIKLNPEDIDSIKEVKEDFLSQFDNIAEMELVSDKAVNRGGCIIETDNGIVDSNISTRFEAVKEELFKDFK